MPRHTPRDRVDRIFDVDAFLLELIGHFAQRVLRLCDRHAVTGDDDDIFGLAHQESGVFGAARFPWTLLFRSAARGRSVGTEAARDHADEASVHRAAYDVRQEDRTSTRMNSRQ